MCLRCLAFNPNPVCVKQKIPFDLKCTHIPFSFQFVVAFVGVHLVWCPNIQIRVNPAKMNKRDALDKILPWKWWNLRKLGAIGCILGGIFRIISQNEMLIVGQNFCFSGSPLEKHFLNHITLNLAQGWIYVLKMGKKGVKYLGQICVCTSTMCCLILQLY